jgi:hypothetical protein
MMKEILGLFITLSALWHVIAFAYGIVFIHFSLKSVFNIVPYNKEWSPVIRGADLHLWMSGLALIILGILDKGVDIYISNPKLWTKVTVVIVWMLSTLLMRKYAVPALKNGSNELMIKFSALNISCWIYGAVLGCAKPLAYGAVSYPVFILGFILTVIACLFVLNLVKIRSVR